MQARQPQFAHVLETYIKQCDLFNGGVMDDDATNTMDWSKLANPDGTASFMRSYPNRIPLSAAVVQRLANATDALTFDRLYNNFGAIIDADARRQLAVCDGDAGVGRREGAVG